MKIPLQNCYYVWRLRILEYFIFGRVLMKVNQLNDSMLYYYSFYNIVLKFDIPKCCNSDFFACRLFQGLKITDIISALTFHYFSLYCCYRKCCSKSLWFLDLESSRNFAEKRWWFENWLSSSVWYPDFLAKRHCKCEKRAMMRKQLSHCAVVAAKLEK